MGLLETVATKLARPGGPSSEKASLDSRDMELTNVVRDGSSSLGVERAVEAKSDSENVAWSVANPMTAAADSASKSQGVSSTMESRRESQGYSDAIGPGMLQ